MERETATRLLETELHEARQVASSQRAMLAEPADEIFDELATVDQHQADTGTETYEREKALTIAQIAEERIADIEHALTKLAAGTFGRCETCGVAISDERLVARPDARFCAEHERDWKLGRIGLTVADMPASWSEPADPGWRELDILPDDELAEAEQSLSAEEAALHVEPFEHGVSAAEAEAIEAAADAEEEDARRRTARNRLDALDDLEDALAEERRFEVS